MTAAARFQVASAKPQPVSLSVSSGLLQRKCACGSFKTPLVEVCENCQSRTLQTKLVIGASDDPLEREADQIADQVMRTAAPVFSVWGERSYRPASNELRRFCTTCEQDEEDMALRREAAPKVTGSGVGALSPVVHEVLRSAGQPLDTATRAFFEPRFGFNFAHVRVHVGERAQAAAEAIGAKAFSWREHIVLGDGATPSRGGEGRKLLAHELSHVMQTSTGCTGMLLPARFAGEHPNAFSKTSPQSAPPIIRRTPDPRLADILDAIRTIRGPYTTEGLVDLILEQISGVNLQDPDNLRPIAGTIADVHGGDALVRFLTQVQATTEVSGPTPQPEPTSEQQAQMERQLRLFQLQRRGPYGTVGLGIALPVLAGAARPILEPLMYAYQSAGAFVGGLYEGLQRSVNRTDADRFAQQLLGSSILTVVFPIPFAAGAVVGIGQDIYEAVRGLIETIANLPEIVSATLELIRTLLSEGGADVAREAGEQIGREFGQRIVELSQANIFRFTFELGRLVGPTIVYTVLAFLGVPEVLASAIVARLLPVLRPLMQRLPRLARLLENVADRRRLTGGRRGREAVASEGRERRRAEAVQSEAEEAVVGERRPFSPGEEAIEAAPRVEPPTPLSGPSGPTARGATRVRAPARSGVYSVERPTRGDPRVVIRSWLGEAEARAGLEREMMSAGEYGIEELAGWQRAHSQGPGLGVESGEAIRLAPESVNQALQNRGIEGFLRSLRDLVEGERIHLTTVTRTHSGTLRLASIHYIVESPEASRMITLFEAVIEVRPNGQARAGVRLPGSDAYTWGPWLGEGGATPGP